MTQYLLSVHHDGTEDVEGGCQDDMQRVFKQVDDFNADLQEVRQLGLRRRHPADRGHHGGRRAPARAG